jgi:sec-independent protein translocase protein TatA
MGPYPFCTSRLHASFIPEGLSGGREFYAAVMPNIGPLELIIVLVIVLIVVGPKKLPGLGKSLGTGMREFKDSVAGNGKSDDEDQLLEQRKQPVAPVVTPTAAPTPAQVIQGEVVQQPGTPPHAAPPVQQPAPADPSAPKNPEAH